MGNKIKDIAYGVAVGISAIFIFCFFDIIINGWSVDVLLIKCLTILSTVQLLCFIVGASVKDDREEDNYTASYYKNCK